MRKSYLRALCVLLLCLFGHLAVAQEEDSDYADFACLTPEQQAQFKGPNNAVCKIDWIGSNNIESEGTGVLVNNTNKDGRLLILTVAHNLPMDTDGKLLPTIQLNEKLATYEFMFFDERRSCDIAEEADDGMLLTGAKLVGIYSLTNPGTFYEGAYQTDVALLELLEKPNYTEDPEWKYLFYAGWNIETNGGLPADVGVNDKGFLEAGLLISHPFGFLKKVIVPKKVRKAALTVTFNNDNTSVEFNSTALPIDQLHWVNQRPADFYTTYGGGRIFNGLPAGGSSGAPYYNQNGQIYSIYRGKSLIGSYDYN